MYSTYCECIHLNLVLCSQTTFSFSLPQYKREKWSGYARLILTVDTIQWIKFPTWFLGIAGALVGIWYKKLPQKRRIWQKYRVKSPIIPTYPRTGVVGLTIDRCIMYLSISFPTFSRDVKCTLTVGWSTVTVKAKVKGQEHRFVLIANGQGCYFQSTVNGTLCFHNLF